VTRLRIAVIGPLAMPNRQGGMSRHCEEIYARLAARGHDVTVFAARLPSGPSYRGLRIRRVPTLPVPGWDRLVYSLVAGLLAATGPFDVVHYHSFANTASCFLPRLARRRVVVTVHRVEWQDEKWGPLTRALLRAGEWSALRFADALIAVSPHLRDDLAARSARGADVHVISNGVTLPEDVGIAALDRFGLAPGRYLLSVGRLVPDKGWDVVLDALVRLGAAELDGLVYVMVGDARTETAYVRALRARTARSSPPARMLGTVPPEELDELYAGACLQISPSFQEGQPLTVLEAMSHGRCIVASDIPAHREVLGDAGILYPARDADALAAALRGALRDPGRRAELGEAARHRVEDGDRSWDRAADATEAVLEEAVR
jgi:glycosyltransferase involved in cell wall biosynthesis